MELQKVFIAHSWNDVSVNIQTKKVAYKLSEQCKVLFITQSRIGQKQMQVNENMQVVEWPNKRPTKLKDFVFMYRLLKKEKPQAVIAHFGGTNNMMLASWFAGIPYRIAWMHTLTEQNKLDVKSKWLAAWNIFKRSFIYKFATQVVVLNEYGKMDAINNYGIAPQKIFVITNGIEDPHQLNHNAGSDMLVRYIGRIDYSKGTDILIKAFEKVLLQYPKATLEMLGKGSLKEEITAEMEKKGLTTHIRFHPLLSSFSEIYHMYCGAYCVVVPSRLDNFPTVVLEAMATQTAIIAADTGGIPEMIDDGYNGLLFEKENADDLAGKLMMLLEDVELRNRLAKAGREKFNEQFVMNKHVDKVIQFLKQL